VPPRHLSGRRSESRWVTLDSRSTLPKPPPSLSLSVVGSDDGPECQPLTQPLTAIFRLREHDHRSGATAGLEPGSRERTDAQPLVSVSSRIRPANDRKTSRNEGTPGASSPQVRSRIRPSPQVAKSARKLSRVETRVSPLPATRLPPGGTAPIPGLPTAPLPARDRSLGRTARSGRSPSYRAPTTWRRPVPSSLTLRMS
jgi:hypothetical protein